MMSAAASVLVTFIGKRIISKVSERKQLVQNDLKLTNALEDSMDCSDPVAKY